MEETTEKSEFQLYYEVKCLSYRKKNVFFIPSCYIAFVLMHSSTPVLSFNSKTSYDLGELKNPKDYSNIINLIKKIEKSGVFLFERSSEGKIFKRNNKNLCSANIRRFLLILIDTIAKNSTISIYTDSFFSKIWLSNFRLSSSYQIINKHRVLNIDINTVSVKPVYDKKEIIHHERIVNDVSNCDHLENIINFFACKDTDEPKKVNSSHLIDNLVEMMRSCEIL